MKQRLIRIQVAIILLLGVMGYSFLTHSTPNPLYIGGFGEPKIGGAFALSDMRGHLVTDSDFHGKVSLIYMGYSNCPDICPMTLTVMGDALKALGPDADKVTAIFISLDPARDTPQVLASYLAHFDKRIIALTGNEEQLAQIVQAYKGYYKKVPLPDTQGVSKPPSLERERSEQSVDEPGATKNYAIDHAGFLYLMDKNGKYVTHFGPDVKTDELVKAVKAKL